MQNVSETLLFAMLVLSAIFGMPAIIGSIITPFFKLREYMREREKEGKSWIDPAEPEKKEGQEE